jgi:hypothetical protein
MEQVRKGITFRHMDKNGKEVSEHVPSTKEDVNQVDDLATVFTPGVLKVPSSPTLLLLAHHDPVSFASLALQPSCDAEASLSFPMKQQTATEVDVLRFS